MKTKDEQISVKSILKTIKLEIDAVAESNIESYSSLLTKDSEFMPPNSLPLKGKELLLWLKDFLEKFNVEWIEFLHKNVEAAEGLGFHEYSFRWRLTPKNGGDSKEHKGKGIHILRKERDGSWKIAREIWNNSI